VSFIASMKINSVMTSSFTTRMNTSTLVRTVIQRHRKLEEHLNCIT
jgi:hypothetical protein